MGTHAGNWIVLNDKTGGGKIVIPAGIRSRPSGFVRS